LTRSQQRYNAHPTEVFCVLFLIEHYIEIMPGIPIPAEAVLGPGLLIHHFGGIIVHFKAVVGEACTRYYGVTLGGLGE